MDALLLSRIQFAFTVGFHFIFPPLSIGLGLLLIFFEGMYLKTKNPEWEKITKFWVKIFALIFGFGVATGVVMEMEFGTNWSNYSRFVGDVFGSPLAAEGIFAFFLESSFLALLVFGWNKVSPKMHFFSTIMVAFGAHLSALWILVANSWQQTPAGFHLVETPQGLRAEIINFWDMVFNPSTLDRLAHTITAAWVTGITLVLAVSAYHILKNKNIESAKKTLKIAIIGLAITSLLQLGAGHASAIGVFQNQPTKLAAFEGHYKTGPGDLYLFGWVDEAKGEVHGIKIPGLFSWLVDFSTTTEIKGLNDFNKEDIPPVNIVFQTYHIMIALGMFFIGLGWLGVLMLRKGKVYNSKIMLYLFIASIFLSQLANQVGWIAAEVGRQPWVVYGLLRTKDALSPMVSTGEVTFSIIMFFVVYVALGILFVKLMLKKIKEGIA